MGQTLARNSTVTLHLEDVEVQNIIIALGGAGTGGAHDDLIAYLERKRAGKRAVPGSRPRGADSNPPATGDPRRMTLPTTRLSVPLRTARLPLLGNRAVVRDGVTSP